MNIFRLNFFSKYEYKYIFLKSFLADTNIDIFGSPFFKDKYEYKFIQVYQKSAIMNTNTNIWTGIHKYEYKYTLSC